MLAGDVSEQSTIAWEGERPKQKSLFIFHIIITAEVHGGT